MRENIEKLKQKIPAEVKILAATKGVAVDKILMASEQNVELFGENRVQEFLQKHDITKHLNWHFIGSLQTNKVKYIIDKVSLIHSVDSERLAFEIDKQAKKIGKVQDILIEINAAGEQSKSGVSLDKIEALYQFVKSQKNLSLVGFMPVLPIAAEEILYKQMQDIFVKFQKKDNNITVLSMGMSDDYMLAIKYGATIVRLGSIIFGKRSY